jgi:hypothetical protein
LVEFSRFSSGLCLVDLFFKYFYTPKNITIKIITTIETIKIINKLEDKPESLSGGISS